MAKVGLTNGFAMVNIVIHICYTEVLTLDALGFLIPTVNNAGYLHKYTHAWITMLGFLETFLHPLLVEVARC